VIESRCGLSHSDCVNTTSLSGLSDAEARDALSRWGANELPPPGLRSVRQIAVETLREPMFALMLGAAALYLVVGDIGEGAFLVVAACAAIGLVIFQEARSERALAALRDLAQPYARVIRDGAQRKVPAREIVPGDVMLVGEGDRICADALLMAGDLLAVDESALTGESAPVHKRLLREGETFSETATLVSDISPQLLSGALVVRGQGVARVTETGARSALGRIGRSLSEIDQGPTPLQRKAGRIVGLLGVFALAFCLVIVLAFGLLRGDWMAGALAGITAAIALVPEEFPMVLAVFLALGAWRLAGHNVLVRRSAVVETLGGASVLCVDKTGTLTQNHMQLKRLRSASGVEGLAGNITSAGRDLVLYARRASSERPVDPMDRAIHEAATVLSLDTERALLQRSWPLRAELTAVTQAWLDEGKHVAAVKGAPEAVIRLCQLDAATAAAVHRDLNAFAHEGLRVLAVARWESGQPLSDPLEATDFQFLGLIGFLDPLREDVPEALASARAAGLKVIMITGDHPATAAAIAVAAGIETAEVTTGDRLAQMLQPELQEALRAHRVFARVAPEQKLAIVEALKANGEIVAMTGDGVNDAPALRAAHIGIAMGKKGTDVARETADLVLLDDGFASIVGGVRMGRRIFTNLRKALIYVTAIHVPIAGLALAPILLGLPQLLFPMHVVLLELAIDPTCALAFEGERSDEDAMKRPPRRPDEPLFGRRELLQAIVQGGVILACVLALYIVALKTMTEAETRAVAFVALIVANITLALVDAAGDKGRLLDSSRRVFWFIAGALLTALALVVAVAPLAAVFHLRAPPLPWLVTSIALGLLAGGWRWGVRRLWDMFTARAPSSSQLGAGP